MGVTKDNFEFYIGTHPHSDHIGSADEIIRAFHPKRVYLEPYSDSDITDSTHYWDNLYVYDRAVAAAKETGATLIQYFNTDAPLYPETVTVKGSIVWTVPEEPEVPETQTAQEKPLTTVPDAMRPAFDYSGLTDQTVEDLHFAENEYRHGKQMAERGLVHMGNAIAAAHLSLIHI